MKIYIILIFSLLVITNTYSQIKIADEQIVLDLSKDKWQWMADKDVVKLEPLFHNDSRFVHMSGTWGKAKELEIIKTGSIWYKKAEIHDVLIKSFGQKTFIVWNRITLTANVRGEDVTTQFTVTEVYQKQDSGIQLLDLTFSSVRDTHGLEH